MSLFFTSDLHVGHANIIKYCNRPFSSVDEMNEKLIINWNKEVTDDDTVIVIGDVFFCNAEQCVDFLSRVKGKKQLIYGNHDKQIKSNKHIQNMFEKIYPDLYETKIDDISVTMCHYPMVSWNKSFHGSFMLHGHTHGALPFDPNIRRLDIGVDCHNYAPVSWEKIKETLNKIDVKSAKHY